MVKANLGMREGILTNHRRAGEKERVEKMREGITCEENLYQLR